MGSKYIGELRSKKGTTMVEVLVSVLILAIVVVGVLTTISFSQRTILSGGSEDKAAAEAQTLTDTLIREVNNATDVSKITVSDVFRVPEGSTFPDKTQGKQFTIITINPDDDDNPDKVEGYQIKTAVYYSDSTGRKCVQMTAFAAKGGVAP